MTPEALDFKAECEQIHALLKAQDASIFDQVTQFKDWTIGDIIAHLHLWNIGADLSLNDPEAFTDFIRGAMTQLGTGKSHAEFQAAYFKGQSAAEVFAAWTAYFPAMADRFYGVDPDRRVKWAGPGYVCSLLYHRAANGALGPCASYFRCHGSGPHKCRPH